MALVGSLLMGLVLYGTYRYAEYFDFKRVSHNDILELHPNASDSDVAVVIDAFLEDEVGKTGFPGFVALQAEEGLSISSTRSYSTEPTHVGTPITVIYWGLEVLVIIGFIASLTYERAKQPYCTEIEDWLESIQIGQIRPQQWSRFAAGVKSGNVSQVKDLIGSGVPFPRFEVSIGCCHALAQEARLRVKSNNGKQTRKVLDMVITREQYEVLLKHTDS